MRLVDLMPEFLRHEVREDTWYECKQDHVHDPSCGVKVTGPREFFIPVQTLALAQGVEFDNPVATTGDFRVLIWFRDRGVPDSAEPGPGRWLASGSGFHDLTLEPSVDLTCGGKYLGLWHGWVRNGEVT